MRLRWTALILLLIAVPAVAQQANQYWRSGSGVNPFAPVSTSNPLPVNVVAGGGAGGTSSNFGDAFPAAGTAAGFTDGTNMVGGRVGAVSNVAVATGFLDALGVGQYLATPPTLTDTRYNALQLDINGNLRVVSTNGGAVTIVDGGDVGLGATTATAATAGSTGSVNAKLRLMTTQLDTINTNIQGAVPCLNATAFNTNSYSNAGVNPANCDLNGGLYVHPPANQTVNVAQINGVTPLMGNGATGTGSHRVTLSNDNTIPTGWPTATGQSTAQPRVPTVGTTGGAIPSSAIAPATPAGVNLKASAGTLYGIQCTTIQATPVYVKIYNASSAPTCGSGTPVLRFMCPSASTAANGAGNNPSLPAVGVAMGTGLGYCVTGALADNDTTAITAANTLVNIEWN